MAPPADPVLRAEALLAEAAAACASDAAAEVLLDARDLREAEWARCRVADRLRAARAPVWVEVARLRLRGWVEAAGADLAVLDDGRERHAVSLRAVLGIRGLPAALAEERAAPERLLAVGWTAHARTLIGESVRIIRADDAVIAARLVAAGADHLEAVTGPSSWVGQEPARMAIPFAAIALMTSRSRMGASRRSAGSGRTSG